MKTEFFLQKIREEFPQLRWKRFEHITHGWDYDVIILDREIVFRFPRTLDYTKRLNNEMQLLKYLRRRVRVGIPEYCYIAKDRSFAGYNILKGRELRLWRYRRLSLENKDIFAKQIASFITILHKTPVSVFSGCELPYEDQVKLYNELVRDLREYLFPQIQGEDIIMIERYLVEFEKILVSDYKDVLVHNDLTGEHILWDKEKGGINIIDFGDCTFGDPASDFAGLLEYGQQFIKKVFMYYGGEKDRNLMKRAQLYFKRIPLWIMVDSIKGYPISFEEGYKIFKRRFRT